MKFSTANVLVGSATLASAFPAAILKKVANDPALRARAAEIEASHPKRQVTADGATALFEPVPMFNAQDQYVDVSNTSGHAWVAPGESDLRGPCPGLNAFANHGFLPHNGYATITQFIEATNSVVGMGPDLAAFLAVLGASIDGDGTAWSIGGTPPASVGDSLAPLGNGISGSHNKYESDASPTRPDLYETGNDYETQADQFNQLISMSPGGSVDLNSLTEFRSTRFDTQIQNNPYFFNGPFTGVLVQPAAYTFIYRFMANHSQENPYGLLSYDTVASWFGMTMNGDTYVANQGMERIPDNWYKRALAYPYTNEYFLADVANAAALYPKFLDIGGNTGTTNSFTGVNVEDLSGGLYNAQTLSQNNGFACLAYQFAAQVKPDVALGALTSLTNALSPILGQLSCPTLEAKDESQLETFPGYSKSGVAPS
ncbi:hypothetical protein MYCFIDRAFT_50025 [Lecanosticta acicola]|uniref:Heme haloperoxidase family profile domain-containing protein n=1 Tax=Lecanosticta acicola TaxID=111012 RepID=A0AAI8Z5C9_9PEZI|nr:hypothetical protein MYCFIDRAFT_50025 [Lecanosticta acicola]